MPVTNSDAVLHYDVGVWGELGYGVPNPSDDYGTLNATIHELVTGAGAQLFAIMHHPDADMRQPPRINTLLRIDRLYKSLTRLLSGRMVRANEREMEANHIQTGGYIFIAHPCPYFKVRNIYMKRWAGYIMMMMANAMQHTENRRPIEISEAFANEVGQYLRRVYQEMAIELFGKSRDEVRDNPAFFLDDADFAAYDPTQLFPGTEAYDTVPPLENVMTEDDLGKLKNGIYYSNMPTLRPYPVNIKDYYNQVRATDPSAAGTSTGTTTTTTAPGTIAAPTPLGDPPLS
ncbi:hypothetical protein V7x_28630 [Crateriforma conspicua]|uniref:Uncharacterized protein n=1 Tax=Crateriforma conspicua TaxID=2527996 RepID=A0A5C6FWM3_9PLAN|nr:hypothetical protein [Crateriforma conspicua]TWU67289.1 hypothetical protein V7x_28630 [Crateriforma conspicua]